MSPYCSVQISLREEMIGSTCTYNALSDLFMFFLLLPTSNVQFCALPHQIHHSIYYCHTYIYIYITHFCLFSVMV